MSIYEEVTARIVGQLEAGVFPWVKPWATSEASMPTNFQTKRPYSGVNVLILWSSPFPSPYWLTFKQALNLGGCVRKGEKGTTVVYADRFTPKGQDGDPKSIPFLKKFTVFNVSQIDDLTGVPLPVPADPASQVQEAEELIIQSGARFQTGGDRAFYVPSQDYIQVPPHSAFFEPIAYYRTAFHELGHWTAHASRLDRDLKGVFGSPSYAKEELVAEMTSAFICASLGIVPTVRHADYLGSWLQVLKNDNKAIFKAARMATKASDFLLAYRQLVELQEAA
jgi:antirestriction protein ArdC